MLPKLRDLLKLRKPQSPASWEELFQEARSLHQQGELEKAIELYGQCVERTPDRAEAYYERANALISLRRLEPSLEDYEAAIRLKGDFAEAYANHGNVLQELWRDEAAIESFERAIALNPSIAQAFYGYGVSLHRCRRLEPALAAYNKAIALKPDLAIAYHSRANLFADLDRHAEAVADYFKATELEPDPATFQSLASYLVRIKRFDHAIEALDEAIALDPYGGSYLLGDSRSTKMRACFWDDLDGDLGRIDKGISERRPVCTPWVLAALTDSPALLRSAAEIFVQDQIDRSCGEDLSRIAEISPGPLSRRRSAKVRIGYFSADFREHPVAYLTAGLFERHDRAKFEVTAFAFGPAETNGAIASRLTKAFDRFIDVRQKSDLEVAALARELGIDIAVDMNGFTTHCRPRIFALRAAPIQINFLGYPGTLGAGFMDYLIADGIVVPREQQRHYAEKIAYLPNSFLPFDSSYVIADRTFSRDELGLPPSGFVFCCFNNSYKILPEVFDRWMRILSRTGNSVLWLQQADATSAANLRREAERRGIDAGRLVFADRVASLPEHLARLRVADLFLDTFPYNAHATALDALWTGVPLLTCPGESFASRVAASLVRTVGLSELIANSPSQYEEKAVELAADPVRLGELRRKLALRDTPLFDTEHYTRNLEAAYEAIYERHHSGSPPAHINEHLATSTPTTSGTAMSAPSPVSWEELFQRAQGLQQQGQLESAIELYGQCIEREPQRAEAYYKRANVLNGLGRLEPALEDYDCAIRYNPSYAYALCNRGSVLERLGRPAEALASYDRAIEVDPKDALTHYNRGSVLKDLERYEDALASYESAIELNGNYAEAHINRGSVLQEVWRHEAALESFERAIALNPSIALGFQGRGACLHRLKRLEQALADFNRALALKPDLAAAYFGRGALLADLDRHAEAVTDYSRATELEPDAATYQSLASSLVRLKRFDLAIASVDKAVTLDPDGHYVLGTSRATKMHASYWAGLGEDLERISKGVSERKPVCNPLTLASLIDSAPLLRSAAEIFVREEIDRSCGEDLKRIAEISPAPLSRPRSAKVRIGYFSADFREHPVAYLTAGLFERHDRAKFEIIAFVSGPQSSDAMQLRLAKAFDRFIDVRQKSDFEVAALARELGIDIAVDLNGFTAHCRTRIFALRAAPIQVNFLGYPGTLGAGFMDYLIADGMVVPREQQRHYAEKIAYLPNSFLPFDSSYAIADRAFSREELGLPSSGFVFCCFNNSYKILPEVFARWMRILSRTSNSVLWLQRADAAVADNLRKEASRCGVEPARLIFADRVASLPEHVARLRIADLFLDTFPYNAHATALDALWAGVPLLTYPGESFASRVAASLVHTVGLPELIADSPSQYEEKAAELAANPIRLGELRRKLALRDTPLFDTERYTRNLEATFEAIYERHHSGFPPAHINEHLAT
jgi:predicted O-linked N-acetylglucosamine transferase (SPINDLY family)